LIKVISADKLTVTFGDPVPGDQINKPKRIFKITIEDLRNAERKSAEAYQQRVIDLNDCNTEELLKAWWQPRETDKKILPVHQQMLQELSNERRSDTPG
jgi:hypothetical protein